MTLMPGPESLGWLKQKLVSVKGSVKFLENSPVKCYSSPSFFILPYCSFLAFSIIASNVFSICSHTTIALKLLIKDPSK